MSVNIFFDTDLDRCPCLGAARYADILEAELWMISTYYGGAVGRNILLRVSAATYVVKTSA